MRFSAFSSSLFPYCLGSTDVQVQYNNHNASDNLNSLPIDNYFEPCYNYHKPCHNHVRNCATRHRRVWRCPGYH